MNFPPVKLDSHSLHDRLSVFALDKTCEPLPDGSLRLTTPLLYPDGSAVVVDYQAGNDLFWSARLTDGGRTFAYLAGLQVDMESHEKREHILRAVCQTLRVERRGSELYLGLEPEGDVADGVARLAQACIRVADLHYTQAFKNTKDFHQIFFADFLSGAHPDHIENSTIEGRFGRKVKLDFFVRQPAARDHLIITMTSTNRTSSHAVANDVFCRWYDLERYKNDYTFLTVLDSNSRAFHDADIHRVADLSTVIRYPLEAEKLRGMLAR